SSYIDRFTFTNNSDYLNIESLIENLKNVIIKKLSILYIIKSSVFLSALSVSFSATSLQSRTPVSVSDSPASTISVSVTSTSATSLQSRTPVSVSDSPASTISVSVTSTSATSASATAFITSSSHFKKMLYRLDKLHFSMCTLLLFLLISRIIYYICVFEIENKDVVLFYTYKYKTSTS
ncbi:hypothetical protein BDFG_09462, partial [Blastomyces dermatitidis ATCC 26199]